MPILSHPSWVSDDPWVNQGEKFAPVITLPDNRTLATCQKRADVQPDTIIGRGGVTAVRNQNATLEKQHYFKHATDFMYILGSQPGMAYDMTRNQVRSMASFPPYGCEGNDFGEGPFWFAPDSDQAKWYYERRAEIYADPATNPNGIPYRNYGHHGCTIALQGTNGPWMNNDGAHIPPTSPFFRNRYKSVSDARAGLGYFNITVNGKRYEDIVGCNVKHYAETADYARNFYSKRYAIDIMGKGMGKNGGLGPGYLLFNDWAKIEGIGGYPMSTINGEHYYQRKIDNPEGIVKSLAHAQIDYDFQVGCYFINGFCYADGVSTFDTPVRYGTDPSKMRPVNVVTEQNDDKTSVEWIPKTAGTPAPATQEGYPIEPNKWHDAALEAATYYSQMDRTAGVGWQPMAYRFDGSETWIEPPADGASILEHAAAFDGVNATAQGARRGRPVVDGRWKNSALDFVAFDPSRGKMYREKIYVRAPNGDVFPSIVQGCKPNIHRETISN